MHDDDDVRKSDSDSERRVQMRSHVLLRVLPRLQRLLQLHFVLMVVTAADAAGVVAMGYWSKMLDVASPSMPSVAPPN